MGDPRTTVGVSAGIDRAEPAVEPSRRDGRVPPVYALVPYASRGATAAGRVAEHCAKGERVPARPAVEVDHPARGRGIPRDRREPVGVDAREEALPPRPAAQVAAAGADANARGRLVTAQDEGDVGDRRRWQPAGRGDHYSDPFVRLRMSCATPGRAASLKPAASAASRDAWLDLRMCR